MIPPLVKGGGGGRVDGNRKRGSRIQVNDYEEQFTETISNQMLEGYFGRLERIRTIRSQSRRTLTLEENAQRPGSNSWQRSFTFDLTQTIEFVGGGCDNSDGLM